MPRWQKTGLYASIAVLFLSGVCWLIVQWVPALLDESNEAIAFSLPTYKRVAIQVHGAASIVALTLFGSLLIHHVPAGWRLATRRISGALNLLALLVLMITTVGIWYAQLGVVRDISACVHWGIGLGLPILIGVHRLNSQSRKTSPRNSNA
jgi:hypothetical protein